MFARTSRTALPLALIALLWGSSAQAQDATSVRVPIYPNKSCAIMGKRASKSLYVDTDYGRIYICCAPCVDEILPDPQSAHEITYPVVKDAKNTTCPLTGKSVGADSPKVLLQAYRVRLHAKELIPTARKRSQLVLALALDKTLSDVGNERCPLTGKPVGNHIVAIGSRLVRLETDKLLKAVKKDPAGVLAKATAIAAKDKPGSGKGD